MLINVEAPWHCWRSTNRIPFPELGGADKKKAPNPSEAETGETFLLESPILLS
jgi:hypothetical protein